jgi:hypothetical protein
MAVMILVSSCAAFAYSLAPRGDTTKVIVNDVEYTRNDVFTYFGDITFEVDGDLFEGVRLSDIIIDSGLPNAVSHDYRIIGSDTYQKDVRWDDMVNGYLVEDEFKTVFPELTKSFWVSDVVYIEVI